MAQYFQELYCKNTFWVMNVQYIQEHNFRTLSLQKNTFSYIFHEITGQYF